MTATSWPTTGMPNPMAYQIKPIETAVGPTSPYTGSREVMHRWHQWHMLIQWNHTESLDYLALFGHFNTARGGVTIYQIPFGFYRAMRGSKSGSVTLSGDHAAGARSLTITGGTGALSRGDWIQISQASNVPRAYVVTSTEAGGVIGINPGLRTATSNGTTVQHLASVSDGFIKDSMELADPDFASSMPSPSPGYFQPFALEFVTALRLSP